jgi:hypothetical protein
MLWILFAGILETRYTIHLNEFFCWEEVACPQLRSLKRVKVEPKVKVTVFGSFVNSIYVIAVVKRENLPFRKKFTTTLRQKIKLPSALLD